jgi:hypothetical protein
LLAYVFSHEPAPEVDVAGYEAVLRRFHEALASMRPEGFIRSLTYRIGPGYSDWYLVETSAALDPLNAAAVSGARAASHDAAARMATNGAGKLLSLVAGELDEQAVVETRFSKPKGMAYRDLYSSLEHITGQPGTSLWRRMMVLGPPPEFSLVARAPADLPAAMHPESFTRRAI